MLPTANPEVRIIERVERWLTEVVIGLNLCPFARAVHVKKQIRFRVLQADSSDAVAGALCEELQQLHRSEQIEIDTTLLIVLGALDDFAKYNNFLDTADALLAGLGFEGVFQIASFHPRYQFADTEPEDVTNCTNRAPFPILHVLRESSVSRAVEAFPDAEAIYLRNMDTMRCLTAHQRKAFGFE